MSYSEINNITITQIRCFLSVVEANSFARAARLLNMTQSGVSKNISSLEELLGFNLFIRDKKRIIVTDAANFLYKEWLTTVSHLDKTIEDVRSMQGGDNNTLYIGMLSTHKPNIYLYPLMEIFKCINPKVNVHVEDCTSEKVRSKLIEGEFDIAFNVLYDLEELGDQFFNSMQILECPLAVGMLKSNPLCSKEEVTMEDLVDSNFICISTRYTPAYYGMLKTLCANAGFQPKITRYTDNASSQLLNLRTRNDVFVCDKFYISYGNPYFEWRPIKGTKSGVVAYWKSDNSKKGLYDFVESIKEYSSIGKIYS